MMSTIPLSLHDRSCDMAAVKMELRSELSEPDPAAASSFAFVFTSHRLSLMKRNCVLKEDQSRDDNNTPTNLASKLSARGSKFKGVNLHRRGKRWEAHIWYGKKQLHIGCFKSEVAAAVAFDIIALKLKGLGTQLNYNAPCYQLELQAMKYMTNEQVQCVVRDMARGKHGSDPGFVKDSMDTEEAQHEEQQQCVSMHSPSHPADSCAPNTSLYLPAVVPSGSHPQTTLSPAARAALGAAAPSPGDDTSEEDSEAASAVMTPLPGMDTSIATAHPLSLPSVAPPPTTNNPIPATATSKPLLRAKRTTSTGHKPQTPVPEPTSSAGIQQESRNPGQPPQYPLLQASPLLPSAESPQHQQDPAASTGNQWSGSSGSVPVLSPLSRVPAQSPGEVPEQVSEPTISVASPEQPPQLPSPPPVVPETATLVVARKARRTTTCSSKGASSQRSSLSRVCMPTHSPLPAQYPTGTPVSQPPHPTPPTHPAPPKSTDRLNRAPVHSFADNTKEPNTNTSSRDTAQRAAAVQRLIARLLHADSVHQQCTADTAHADTHMAIPELVHPPADNAAHMLACSSPLPGQRPHQSPHQSFQQVSHHAYAPRPPCNTALPSITMAYPCSRVNLGDPEDDMDAIDAANEIGAPPCNMNQTAPLRSPSPSSTSSCHSPLAYPPRSPRSIPQVHVSPFTHTPDIPSMNTPVISPPPSPYQLPPNHPCHPPALVTNSSVSSAERPITRASPFFNHTSPPSHPSNPPQPPPESPPLPPSMPSLALMDADIHDMFSDLLTPPLDLPHDPHHDLASFSTGATQTLASHPDSCLQTADAAGGSGVTVAAVAAAAAAAAVHSSPCPARCRSPIDALAPTNSCESSIGRLLSGQPDHGVQRDIHSGLVHGQVDDSSLQDELFAGLNPSSQCQLLLGCAAADSGYQVSEPHGVVSNEPHDCTMAAAEPAADDKRLVQEPRMKRVDRVERVGSVLSDPNRRRQLLQGKAKRAAPGPAALERVRSAGLALKQQQQQQQQWVAAALQQDAAQPALLLQQPPAQQQQQQQRQPLGKVQLTATRKPSFLSHKAFAQVCQQFGRKPAQKRDHASMAAPPTAAPLQSPPPAASGSTTTRGSTIPHSTASPVCHTSHMAGPVQPVSLDTTTQLPASGKRTLLQRCDSLRSRCTLAAAAPPADLRSDLRSDQVAREHRLSATAAEPQLPHHQSEVAADGRGELAALLSLWDERPQARPSAPCGALMGSMGNSGQWRQAELQPMGQGDEDLDFDQGIDQHLHQVRHPDFQHGFDHGLHQQVGGQEESDDMAGGFSANMGCVEYDDLHHFVGQHCYSLPNLYGITA